jgi:SOS response associated peptidase (SRAP)
MCGRYALTKTELLEEFFEFSFTGNQILPRFNVAPTTQIPVIRLREDGQRELIDLRWGLVPSWSRPGDQLPLLINARAETLSSKPAFRDAFQRRRCSTNGARPGGMIVLNTTSAPIDMILSIVAPYPFKSRPNMAARRTPLSSDFILSEMGGRKLMDCHAEGFALFGFSCDMAI